jgi:hypothetical protein
MYRPNRLSPGPEMDRSIAMRVDRLRSACRRSRTDLTDLCFITAAGLFTVGVLALVVNRFITPWPIAALMLAAGGFYFLQGAWYLAQNAWQTSNVQRAAAPAAQWHSPAFARSAMNYDHPAEPQSQPASHEADHARTEVGARV